MSSLLTTRLRSFPVVSSAARDSGLVGTTAASRTEGAEAGVAPGERQDARPGDSAKVGEARSTAKRQEKLDVSAAVAGLRVAEEQLRIAQRFVEQPITEITECPLCGLHPHDFTVEEYEREVDRLQKIIDGLRSESHA